MKNDKNAGRRKGLKKQNFRILDHLKFFIKLFQYLRSEKAEILVHCVLKRGKLHGLRFEKFKDLGHRGMNMSKADRQKKTESRLGRRRTVKLRKG